MTKKKEWQRSIILVEQVFKEQGIYFALSLLYDMQYDRQDIKGMMDLLETIKKET